MQNREDQKSRGVYCHYCGTPVHLSTRMIHRERVLSEGEISLPGMLCSRVFPLRCKTCGQETLYVLSQIVDFTEHPEAMAVEEELVHDRHGW
jgi:hypothetical protein